MNSHQLFDLLSTPTLSNIQECITADILSYRAFAKSVDETAFKDTITALKNIQAEITEEVTGKRGETL